MSDATVNIQGMILTLTGAVPDAVTGQVDDVYNEVALYAIRNVVKNGDDLNNISNQVLRYGNDLQQLNTLPNWARIDWNDQTTGMQRTQLLVDLGLIPGGTASGQVINYSSANIAYVTTVNSQSGVPAGTQVPLPIQNIPFPGDGNTVPGFTGTSLSLAADGSTSPPTWFVIDPNNNNKAWQVGYPGTLPTTTQYSYLPSYDLDSWKSLYQTDRQQWVTSLGQLSQDSQLIMQSTTTNYSQALDTASNILQGKANAKLGVANNFY